MVEKETSDPDPLAAIRADVDAWERAIRAGGGVHSCNIAVLYASLRVLLDQVDALTRERDEARQAAQDWELAADGIKHHFHCANNAVTGDPNGQICDRCRAETAEAERDALAAQHAHLQGKGQP